MLYHVKYTVAILAPGWLHPLLWVSRSQPPPSVSLPTNQAESPGMSWAEMDKCLWVCRSPPPSVSIPTTQPESAGMSWSGDQSSQAVAEPWEETTRFTSRYVHGSQAWLENMMRGMDRRAQDTLEEIEYGLLQIKMMMEDEYDGQVDEAGMTENMKAAIAYLQERQHNLDRQWQRIIVLHTQGIYVWDDENPKNKGKSNIVLSRQAREWNSSRCIPAAVLVRAAAEPMTNTEVQPKQGRGLKRSRSADTILDESAG